MPPLNTPLLDALKDEQSQGITQILPAAPNQRRDYIIIDAPGHIEFLKTWFQAQPAQMRLFCH